MKKQLPRVSIITINYNQAQVTTELLDSIRRISYNDLEVIVVDNASREDPGAYLTELYPEIIYIRSEENLGFSGGNNLGIDASSGEYLLFINNDAELTEGAIERLLQLFDEIPDLGIVSPLLCYFNEAPEQNADIIQYAGTTHVHPLTARNKTLGELETNTNQYNEPYPTAYAHGAAMMVPRKVIEQVGKMPELFFLYYEELDWSERIRRGGYKVYLEPRAKVYHKESISVGKMSTLKTFYLNRNRILFMRRNRSIWQLAGFVLFLLFFTIPKNTAMYILKGDFDHLKAFWKAITWHLKNPHEGELKEVPAKLPTFQDA